MAAVDHTQVRTVDVATRHGLARAHLHLVADPTALLVLGHGAGGGVAAPDLVAVTAAARALGITTALVEQPYRVAGRKAPPRAPVLDAAWTDVVEHLGAHTGGLPLVSGGRSAGARVACRTAQATGAVGVLCLAFPTRPPTPAGRLARPDRVHELTEVTVPTLVVQGDRDPYGLPPGGPHRQVITVAGDHSLRKDLTSVATAVADWLATLFPLLPAHPSPAHPCRSAEVADPGRGR